MTSRLIFELFRIHLGRHDIEPDREALSELLTVGEYSPALAAVGGGSQQPRLTAEGVERVGELIALWEDLS